MCRQENSTERFTILFRTRIVPPYLFPMLRKASRTEVTKRARVHEKGLGNMDLECDNFQGGGQEAPGQVD